MTRALILAAAALVFGGTTIAGASETETARDPAKDAAFAARMFSGAVGKDTSYACFVRRYDAAHLVRHPRQKVKAMKLLVSAEQVPEAEGLSYAFHLGVEFRNRGGKFESFGHCGHLDPAENAPDKLHLGCGVECDGGGIGIELARDDKSTLVSIEEIRMWLIGGGPDSEDGVPLKGGADDRWFRLDRANLEDCRSLLPREEHTARIRD
jgi:hypothetical protein